MLKYPKKIQIEYLNNRVLDYLSNHIIKNYVFNFDEATSGITESCKLSLLSRQKSASSKISFWNILMNTDRASLYCLVYN